MTHYINKKREAADITSLFSLHKKDGETLRQFMTRFIMSFFELTIGRQKDNSRGVQEMNSP
ncbi:hypothetical protein FRX31_033279 [Thalictrum thalictroides]|uniref:Uncharacterized protein n=1 Tax=Thalictrum thalictroides TaxID=46969 RepID=A0A7J6UWZ2_THATH|nr:hypothetical protein FRX31_033279 [Thalictrum thalictroides]